MRGKQAFAFAGMLLVLLAVVACDGAATEETAADPNAELFAKIEGLQNDIDGLKSQISALTESLTAEPAEGEEAGEEGAEPGKTPEEIEAEAADLKAQINEKTDELYGQIINYINSSGLVEGAERTPEQTRAFDLKADIDIAYAQEYIDKGGDYKRAIDIYMQALMSDESNAKLLEAKDYAEAMRYMTEERFGQVKKGMSQDEVKALLGTVKNTNIRDFSDKGRLGWFFPKDPEAGGGAAGVYFKEKPKGSENWVVEVTDFDAVKGREGEEEEG